jgi:hypothetical protein
MDALASDPRSILYRGGLINPPDVSVDALATCGGVRSAGDFPLTGLVGESVADLEMDREDMVGQKPNLTPRVLTCDSGGCLPQGFPERVDRGFGLSRRHIGSVTKFKASLHQASCRVTRRLRPPSYFRWKHRALVKMCPNSVGQVCVTPRARV